MNKVPEFLYVPKPVNVTEGDSVSLDCLAVGKPTPKISWHKDKQPLKEDDHVTISSSYDERMPCSSVLSLSSIQPQIHAGKYTVVAENVHGNTSHEVLVSGICDCLSLPMSMHVYGMGL